jgi:exonuclease III
MSELKVLSYNILEGLQHSQVQIDVFVEWVRQQNPDITFYQELNGWREESFAELARRCGHLYSAKIQPDGYRMGISSKYELCDVQRVTDGFRLGCIYARIQDYHVFAVHLDPFEEERRLEEMHQLLEQVNSLPQEAAIMVVGDFNALAESDKDAYDEEFQKNFLLDKRRTRDAQIEFRVTNELLKAGFTDAYKLFHDEFKTSCPTAKRIFQGDAGVRVDYAFLSPVLKAKCTSAEIVHDPITRFLSDHYPLVFTLKT